MELTYTEAQELLNKRFDESPEIRGLITKPEFESTLKELVEYVGLDLSLLPVIKYELLIVLAFYAPINKLAFNISESAGITEETSQRLVAMVDAVLLSDISDELEEFQHAWKNELEKLKGVPEANRDIREKLELHPEKSAKTQDEDGMEEEAVSKPLTREDVLSALSSKRTMASDIESVKKSQKIDSE